jgi:replication-associated recombination protein RarA
MPIDHVLGERMTIQCYSAEELIAILQRTLSYSRRLYVGLDGNPGVGKSTVGRRIADDLGAQLLSLDNFLEKDSEVYVDNLMLACIEKAVIKSTVVFEGCCLLDILSRVNLQLDALIYTENVAS